MLSGPNTASTRTRSRTDRKLPKAAGALAALLLLFLLLHHSTTPSVPIVPAAKGNAAIDIRFGRHAALLLAPDGTIWGWGQQDSVLGEVADMAGWPQFRPLPLGSNWTAIAASSRAGVGIRSDGTLCQWRFDSAGSAPATLVPFAQTNSPQGWRSVAGGWDHLTALDKTGTLWSTGGNARGQLGDGTFFGNTNWVRVKFKGEWKSTTSLDAASFGIDSNETLWHWGFIENPGESQPGFDTRIPNRMEGGPWTRVVPGHLVSAIRDRDGAWWVWGPAAENALGSSQRHRPFRLPPCQDSVAVVIWASSVVRLDPAGRLWICGPTPGPAASSTGPDADPKHWRPLHPERRWNQIWSDAETMLALDSDGVLWAWGRDLSPPTRADRLLSNLSNWLRNHGSSVEFGQAGDRWISDPVPVARIPRPETAEAQRRGE
jgi:hypothetical protein